LIKAALRYDNGTILITGSIAPIPYATVDPRTNLLRAQALYNQSEIVCDDMFLDLIPSPNIFIDNNKKQRSPHFIFKRLSIKGT
jgi:hypothetical protein